MKVRTFNVSILIFSYTKIHFLLLQDKSTANPKFSNLPLFDYVDNNMVLADKRKYLADKSGEIELFLELMASQNIVSDCAWNPLENQSDTPEDSEKKKSRRKSKNDKKLITINTLSKMFVLPDAERFIAIDLLVYGNCTPGATFEKLCSHLRSVCWNYFNYLHL